MAGMNALSDLFENELRDIYDAEKQILKVLPKMAKAVGSEELREMFQTHFEETQNQVQRLEQVFESLDLKARGKHCPGMAGIIEEGKELMGEDGEESVLDAGFVAAAQRVEHYEITAYGSLMAWAKLLGYNEALQLLQQNLAEEKATDKKLSALAESTVNRQAVAAGEEMEEEEEEERPAARPRARAAGRR